MKRVSIKMLQKSFLCGFKGMNNFLIGSVVATAGAALRRTENSSVGSLKRREGLYGMYNNLIPMLETILCIGVLCVLLDRFAFSRVKTLDVRASIAISLAICMLLMMLICTLLRVTGKRKDCCTDYDYEGSFSRRGGYGLHFRIPATEEDRNMLTKFINCSALKFDSWDSYRDAEDDEHVSKCAVFLHFLSALAVWPLFVLMLALNLVELPIVFLLDCFALCCRRKGEKAFDGSGDVVRQMLFNSYQLLEPVLCILPTRAQAAVGRKFQAAVSCIQGNFHGPGSRLNVPEVNVREGLFAASVPGRECVRPPCCGGRIT